MLSSDGQSFAVRWMPSYKKSIGEESKHVRVVQHDVPVVLVGWRLRDISFDLHQSLKRAFRVASVEMSFQAAGSGWFCKPFWLCLKVHVRGSIVLSGRCCLQAGHREA